VIAIGRSLGTGVAVRLVLVTPYDSLQELAVRQFPYFPVRWLIADKFESWKYVPQVKAPAHLIMAEHDEVIPRASTEQLFSRFAKGSATLSVIPGVSHNTVMQHPGYLRMLGSTP
jgi:pimeloyl-ACP methyl ester carboxylesterase